MGNLLLTLILLSNFLLIGFFMFIFVKLSTKIRQIQEYYIKLTTPEAENKPSPLANIVQVVTEMAARSISASLKATFMGKQSGDVRGEQAEQGQMLSVSPNPLISALASFPAIRKGLIKNPALLDLAMSVMSRGKSDNHSEQKSESPKFHL